MKRMNSRNVGRRRCLAVGIGLSLIALCTLGDAGSADQPPQTNSKSDYVSVVQPLLKKYCLECHATKVKKGSLDLERFKTVDHVRKDLKPWQTMIELLEAREMPPKGKPQPTDEERERLIAWTRGFLDSEARANAGDPGNVLLRRLSNAEYNYTIRDLTGVDLQPAREFPADGAGGEGFTNASEALADISPALLNKYLNAAKEISDHAVLLPDGFRFSPTKTRRDWTDECSARIREFYGRFTNDGRLPLQPYVMATVRHRENLSSGKVTLEAVAQQEKLNPKFLQVLWRALTDTTPSFPLDRIRSRWRAASEKDVPAILAEISALQGPLWNYVLIGSYRDHNTVRQLPNDPSVAETQLLRLNVKPEPGKSKVVWYLSTRDLLATGTGGHAVWRRPRFEGTGKPALLLRDYAQFGSQYEVDYRTVFVDTHKYLDAAVAAANDRKRSVADLARAHGVNAAMLSRWIDLLAVEPFVKGTAEARESRRIVPAVALELLEEKQPRNDQKPAINGWRRKGADLPIVVSNASDRTEQIPGRVSPHQVALHPTPSEFVAVAWKSPVEGSVRVTAKIAHAHPGCGNGVAWWLEHRSGDRAFVLAEAALALGKQAQVTPRTLKVAKGDLVLLAVDARDNSHVCDLTEVGLTVTEIEKPRRTWDLAADVADNVLAGNPHEDKLGNKGVWSFVKGPAKPVGYFTAAGSKIPAGSVLARWRDAASSPALRAEAGKLAEEARALLTGPRPAAKDPNRVLFDNLVSIDSPLFQAVDLARLNQAKPKTTKFGLEKERFGDAASLVVPGNSVVEVRLPALLFRDRQFVVDCQLDSNETDRAVQFQVLTAPPAPNSPWDGKSPIVAKPSSAAHKQLVAGLAEFRRVFPPFICFPQIIPTDEVVCLKMFHREDADLVHLFLDDAQKRRLDRLWEEHRFISQQPVAENNYLPQFIGFVTQDQPKELLAYFEGQRPVFKKRADDFLKEMEAAIPKQLEMLADFTARAYRRPLRDAEKTDLLGLYDTLRKKQIPHDEAFRTLLARVLVSPSFLFHLEQSPPGKEARPVNDWELASRLSYFLWSAAPDAELRQAAAAGKLSDGSVLAAQTERMLKDERVRALAIEFGTQWLHVRGFDELKEKNEKLFPSFNEQLRKAIYEESIRFFQDLFQADRPVTNVLDGDYAFLNETLARHYGIPGVVGPHWRQVEGVKKYGRGGILGLASVQTKESGASRTSPVLRGNWVVETLLGEKLPRPPANVPRLPEEETGNDGLSMRQLVEKHTRVPECAVCHVRIDPFGFAFEKYDPIGRFREKDLNGLAIDSRAKLKDGTEFEGIDGLRNYLLTRKKDVIVRLFCRKLLGYALGRATALSDQPLIDEMVAELNKNEGKLSAAVLTIVRSKQFRMIRGSDFANRK
jgi:Protein of unknown function (DUF1592)/Protein of unknown function (DUF1588)/Protein of unknown function (DUF1587)/Protein of unknown function (DUF1585)/Protein of unknown function (DUF1595)